MALRSSDATDAARHQLVDADAEYRRARAAADVARGVRDAAIVVAHRAGLSSREISELVGGIGQPNVVRARRRALAHEGGVPAGFLSPADALRASGLPVSDFIAAVRSGQLVPETSPGGARVFLAKDVRALRPSS